MPTQFYGTPSITFITTSRRHDRLRYASKKASTAFRKKISEGLRGMAAQEPPLGLECFPSKVNRRAASLLLRALGAALSSTKKLVFLFTSNCLST